MAAQKWRKPPPRYAGSGLHKRLGRLSAFTNSARRLFAQVFRCTEIVAAVIASIDPALIVAALVITGAAI